MGHWVRAVEYVTLIGAYTAAVWILLVFPRHAHRRLLIMLDTGWPGRHGYGWRDAGVLLRRQTKRKLGPEPGKHRSGEQEPPPARLVAIMPPEPEHESTVVVADLASGTDAIDAGEALPDEASWHTMPGAGHVHAVTDPAHTMTMTQPVFPAGSTYPHWDGPGPPPPWYPKEGDSDGSEQPARERGRGKGQAR